MTQHSVDTRIAGFLRYLRDAGYKPGIQETLDALEFMHDSQKPDREVARHLLRALTCHDREQWFGFDRLFEQYWFSGDNSSLAVRRQQRWRAHRLAGLAGSSEENIFTENNDNDPASAGAGRQSTISRADFRFLNDQRAAREIERLAENLAAQLKRKIRQRRRLRCHGRLLDIRRTIRRSLPQGGLPIQRLYSKRHQEPPHLVILHDVSHSMAWNNPLLFRFARGLMRTFPNSDAFAFHTELFCVSSLYRERSLQVMRQRLEEKNHLWLGGTCIAESLATFNHYWARATVSRNTIVIIISDGFDTNDPQQLQNELRGLQQQVKKILWLNPMLGREGYTPDDKFIEFTRDHVDRFAPAHSLESLQQAIKYLAAAG